MMATTDSDKPLIPASVATQRPGSRRLRHRQRLLLVVPTTSYGTADSSGTAPKDSSAAAITALAQHSGVAAQVHFIGANSSREEWQSFLAENPADSICVLCWDAPHLPVAFLAEAFARLEHSPIDMVAIAADNDSYCLAGFTFSLWKQLPNLVWDRPEALPIALEMAQGLGARMATLPSWYRLQTADDLLTFRRDTQRGTVTVPGTTAVLGL